MKKNITIFLKVLTYFQELRYLSLKSNNISDIQPPYEINREHPNGGKKPAVSYVVSTHIFINSKSIENRH
ncbi:hypothetical protein Riv7116_1954 [Rivularia sp. PCC 7116]|nr:hypothetical protein Riv7116_1954 [Rivularia sp. PCC 7116]